MERKPAICAPKGDTCTPIGTPPAKVANIVKGIMELNRDINITRKTSRIPGPIFPLKLARSQSVRERPAATFSITYMVEKKCESTTGITWQEKEPEPVPLQQSRNFAPLIAQLKEQIRKKIQTLPSVIYQQREGPNYSPSWSWLRNVTQWEHNAAKEDCEESQYRILKGFYNQVRTCSNILAQIRHDFIEGLQEYEPGNAVDKVCQAMTLTRVGVRGRNTISDAQVPYMKYIFQSELAKQQNYAKWMGKTLSDQNEVKKRNEVALWIITVGKTLKYAADTVHMAVYIMDAYLTIKGNKISNQAWGVLGIAALHIAGKLEEPDPAQMTRLIRLSCQFYKLSEVRWMERNILEKLGFDVYPPLAPLFASMVLLSGSLDFPTIDLRKIAMDLCLGILHKSLREHRLFSIPPADKAKAALEISVEFIFYQYSVYSKRDMSAHVFSTSDPGYSVGSFVLDLCIDTFIQRFVSRNIPKVIPAVTCVASPVRNIKA